MDGIEDLLGIMESQIGSDPASLGGGAAKLLLYWNIDVEAPMGTGASR